MKQAFEEVCRMTQYTLPDGRVVSVGDACKNADVIDFTLSDGRIVSARRVTGFRNGKWTTKPIKPYCEICGPFRRGRMLKTVKGAWRCEDCV